MKLDEDLLEHHLTAGHLTRPKPIEVAVAHRIDRWDREAGRMDPALLARRIKEHMARQLAAHIVDKCFAFEAEHLADLLNGGSEVRMQLTINDAGAYEHWIPIAKREGEAAGRKQALSSLPYGIEPNQYYE